MKRKASSGIMLMLLLTAMSSVVFNVAPVAAEPVVWAYALAWDKNNDGWIRRDGNDEIGFFWEAIPRGEFFHYELYADGILRLSYAAPNLVSIYFTREVVAKYFGTYNEFHIWYGDKTRCHTVIVFKLPRHAWKFPIYPETPSIDIKPETLNIEKTKGRWVTAYIELCPPLDVNNIDVSTIQLSGYYALPSIPVDPEAPTEIGDYDEDGVPDLRVRFDRSAVRNCILNIPGLVVPGEVELLLTGRLFDETPFGGYDKIGLR